jgi:hypothetical protein
MRTPPVRAPLRQRLGDVGRIGLAVARQPHRAHQVVGAHDGILFAGLLGRQRLAFDALGVGHGGERRSSTMRSSVRATIANRTASSRRQAGLGLELGVELGAVADQRVRFW